MPNVDAVNRNAVASLSPGLAHRAYPGKSLTIHPTLKGLHPHALESAPDTTPSGLLKCVAIDLRLSDGIPMGFMIPPQVKTPLSLMKPFEECLEAQLQLLLQ